STRFFHDLGCRVLGLEGCIQAIEHSALPDRMLHHDFCDGPMRGDDKFDMVWSCEFLEHVDRRFVPNILQTFAHAQKLILVTHAFPGQEDGHHHVNCQPTSYWIRQMETIGFRCDAGLTRLARTVTLQDYTGVNHFARSGLVFVRTDDVRQNGGWWSALSARL